MDNTTKNDPDASKQAVSDEDFAALQDKVKALEDALAALKTANASKADAADMTALNNDVTALSSSVASLSAAKQSTLWLYDGNGTKLYKVLSLISNPPSQVAIVEVKTGVTAKYPLNVFSVVANYSSPRAIEYSAIVFTGSNCTGTPYGSDAASGGDYGEGGAVGSYFVYSTTSSARVASLNSSSIYDGVCTNSSGTISGAREVTVEPLNNYRHINPLTVGP